MNESDEWERITKAGRARIAGALASMASVPRERRRLPEGWLNTIANGGGENGKLAQRLLNESVTR